jgi:magnesium chelatase family protein
MLVASMNPCPCGYYSHPGRECICHPGMVQKYLSRISGPLLDRIDIHTEVVPVSFGKMSEGGKAESSSAIRKRVTQARTVQEKRFIRWEGIHCNAQMNTKMIREHCSIDSHGRLLLGNAMDKLGLSARAYDRILKLARTIADLERKPRIESIHLAEAIQYRSLDRESWAVRGVAY